MNHEKAPWQMTETNGARVEALRQPGHWRLSVPPTEKGYTNAQIDDYSVSGAGVFQWRPGVAMTLRARFSAEAESMVGTAGFGFWNAPFGPGAGKGLRLPQAVWFFFASQASNLPLAPVGEEGNGWFVSTIDAGSPRALLWAPLAAPVLLLNQIAALRRMIWPAVRERLGISFERLRIRMADWHEYKLIWRHESTMFLVDGVPYLATASSPRGPLGFVAWVDNQRMVLTPRGKAGWGVEVKDETQWLEIADIHLAPL